MGFLSGIGKAIGGAFNAVKSFAGSALGKNLIGIAGSIFGGPLGSVLGKAATGLLSGGLNFKNLLKTGLDVFGGLTGKLGLTDLVKNLPTALKNPTSLLSSLTNSQGLKGLLSNILSKTGLGQKLSGIINKVSGFLGKVGGFGSKANNVLNAATDFLNKLGIKTPPFLGSFSEKLNSVLNALNKVQEILGQVGNIATGGMSNAMLRA
jgi:hypothetical protein